MHLPPQDITSEPCHDINSIGSTISDLTVDLGGSLNCASMAEKLATSIF